MAGAALNPEWYKKNIKVAAFLAPPATMFYNDSKLIRFAAKPELMHAMNKAADAIGLYDFLPHWAIFSHVAVFLCNLFNHKLCDNFLIYVMNKDPSTDYQDRWDVYASNEPSGASLRNFWHYG